MTFGTFMSHELPDDHSEMTLAQGKDVVETLIVDEVAMAVLAT
jgi:hypothetical protein